MSQTFLDKDYHKVTLYINHQHDVDHILAICKLNNKYVFTKHSKRGIEFVSGKLFEGESAVDGMTREVREETGGVVEDYKYAGYYSVKSENHVFYKAVYFVKLEKLLPQSDYLETNGPILYSSIDEIEKTEQSFLLQDSCIQYLYELSQTDEFFK